MQNYRINYVSNRTLVKWEVQKSGIEGAGLVFWDTVCFCETKEWCELIIEALVRFNV